MNNTLKKVLFLEEKRIQRLIDLTEKEIDSSLRGKLLVQRKKSGNYYSETEPDKQYLGKENHPRVIAYRDNAFRKVRITILKDDLTLVKEFQKQYKDYDAESVFKALPRILRELPNEAVIDQRYQEIRKWADEDCERNPAEMPEKKNIAKDGTEVRSKAECVFYNILYDLNIPFRYDKVFIVINEYGQEKKVYPDFQILCYDGTLIIIEHLGMLLKNNYAMKNLIKIQDYIRSGFIIGKDLILTSENANGGTDSEMLTEIAEWVADRFYRSAK